MSDNKSKSIINSSLTDFGFWESVKILLTKPHVINKRIWDSKLLSRCFVKSINVECKLPARCIDMDPMETKEYMDNVMKDFELELCNDKEGTINNNTVEIVLIELFPRCFSDSHAFQIICLQKSENRVTFYDVTSKNTKQNLIPEFTYILELNNQELTLKCMRDDTGPQKSYNWLANTFLPRFLKLGKHTYKENKNRICEDSLSLVSKERYYEKYNDLKQKYGKEMVKIWPECTDSSKFVYEDVAIATYLLLLWENGQNDRPQQNFVDLGCGNGLLVYILTKEGHKGVGIDVRKRHIWDLYSDDVKLKEITIIPSDANLFPDTDWIVGNHSDELTPWIPVIAARSSYKCSFFLLPCCAYNFDGTKYQRMDSSKSQYTEYLEYIKHICEACGFRTDIDRLKIPSTKRICLVGQTRTHTKEEYDILCFNNINGLLNKEMNLTLSNDSNLLWSKDFKPREAVERVKNCTQIDKSVVNSIVNDVANYLLRDINLETYWSVGKNVSIIELVSLLSQDSLNILKSECGGLQTLLKNNSQIFKVQGGKVQLRYPKTVQEVNDKIKSTRNKSNSIKIRQKPCWFYNKHPQGCPLADNNCSFLHVRENKTEI